MQFPPLEQQSLASEWGIPQASYLFQNHGETRDTEQEFFLLYFQWPASLTYTIEYLVLTFMCCERTQFFTNVDVGGGYICMLADIDRLPGVNRVDCTIGYVHLDIDVGADRLTTYPTIKIETGAIRNLM